MPSGRALPRRQVLQGAAALGGLPAPILNTVTSFAQSGTFDWKRFKGLQVEVLMGTGPRAELMKNYKNEFEDIPGIELGIEVIPKQQARLKVAIELNSGKLSFDLFNFATTSDGKVNTLPIPCDTFMINYNQELLAKKDIPVPKTLDEMMAAAAAINDPAA